MSIENRNLKIVEDYLNSKETPRTLGLKYGLGAHAIRKILKDSGVSLIKERGKLKRGESLGKLHKFIGLFLFYKRNIAVKEIGEIAQKLGISAIKYSKLEKGQVDPTLAELLKICDYYNITLITLIEEANKYEKVELDAQTQEGKTE